MNTLTPHEPIIAYIGKSCGDGMDLDKEGPTSRRHLTDWHGNHIGTCFLSSSWPIRSYIGSRMYQVYAKINGREYKGRSFGEGMSIKLYETAHSIRTNAKTKELSHVTIR